MNNENREEINRLNRLLFERDREFEKAKGRRTILTIAGFSILYFVLFWLISRPSDLSDFLGMLIASFVIACFHFWVNATIFIYLSTKGREESETLENIRKQIKVLEKDAL